MCDLAYVLWLDHLERRQLLQASCAAARIDGSPDDARERLDAFLEAEPVVSQLSTEEMELRAALGVL